MTKIHPHALFRLSVLGPLASRDRLDRGELQALLQELAAKSYAIPNSRRVFLSPKTIEGWYYAWLRGGIDALTPNGRRDQGQSKSPGSGAYRQEGATGPLPEHHPGTGPPGRHPERQ